jgi:SAM-dependent methyltransferase
MSTLRTSTPRPAMAFLGVILIVLPLLGFQHPAPPVKAPVFPMDQESLAPYVPTPQSVVDRMLELAEVSEKDVVYDLGCGDGRIVITAAMKYRAHGVGVDIDPERIREAEANARLAGVQSLVTFKMQDASKVDVSGASVVTLYLLSTSNLKLRPNLTRQLKPGSRIVSHAFSMGDWPPLKTVIVDDEGYPRTLYLWKADGVVRD